VDHPGRPAWQRHSGSYTADPHGLHGDELEMPSAGNRFEGSNLSLSASLEYVAIPTSVGHPGARRLVTPSLTPATPSAGGKPAHNMVRACIFHAVERPQVASTRTGLGPAAGSGNLLVEQEHAELLYRDHAYRPRMRRLLVNTGKSQLQGFSYASR
jgi:hypothetical protein